MEQKFSIMYQVVVGRQLNKDVAKEFRTSP